MKWQYVAGILLTILLGGVLTYTDLFGQLFQLTGVNATHSGDIYCTENCESFINVTTTYWRICFAHYKGTKYADDGVLFKKVSRSRTLHVNLDNVSSLISTKPEVPVDWLVPARGRDNWRPIKDGDCWDRKKINRIKLVGHKKEWENVKWTFEVGDYLEIDPVWNAGVQVGDKIVKELCEIKYEDGIDNINHYQKHTETVIWHNLTPRGKEQFANGSRYDILSYKYNWTDLDYIEEIPYFNREVDCAKTGEIKINEEIIGDDTKFCKLIDEEVCCCPVTSGGKFCAWYRIGIDNSTETVCTKDLESDSFEMV